ncbi:MAG: hypothetical protein B6U65_03150 [Candidatus Wolframiiraptor sp. EX4484-121]|nr:MAG: hypothetical protein B6U65_03150 [Candidatus Wolframiiraptor sp. EX4484-121]
MVKGKPSKIKVLSSKVKQIIPSKMQFHKQGIIEGVGNPSEKELEGMVGSAGRQNLKEWVHKPGKGKRIG